MAATAIVGLEERHFLALLRQQVGAGEAADPRTHDGDRLRLFLRWHLLASVNPDEVGHGHRSGLYFLDSSCLSSVLQRCLELHTGSLDAPAPYMCMRMHMHICMHMCMHMQSVSPWARTTLGRHAGAAANCLLRPLLAASHDDRDEHP